MPSMDPRVLRRFENWSATETIATRFNVSTDKTKKNQKGEIPKKLD